jgi:hypothetical protein
MTLAVQQAHSALIGAHQGWPASWVRMSSSPMSAHHRDIVSPRPARVSGGMLASVHERPSHGDSGFPLDEANHRSQGGLWGQRDVHVARAPPLSVPLQDAMRDRAISEATSGATLHSICSPTRYG